MSPCIAWKGPTAYWLHREPGVRRLLWTRLNSRTEREAREEAKILAAEKLLGRRADGRRPADQPNDIAWEALVKMYLEACEGDGNCKATLERKRLHFNQIDRLMGVAMLSGWTLDKLDDFKLRSRRAGLSPGATNKALTYIKAVLRLARRKKYATLSADDLAEIKQVKRSTVTPPYYTVEDVARILAFASPFWRVAMLLGWFGGLRRGEAMALRWKDVDFKRRELHIADRVDWRSKTRRSRTVPIHDDLLAVLTEWKAVCPAGELVLPWDGDKNTFARSFKRLRKRAGLTEGTFKSLRHGFGTGLMQADVNAMKAQAAMGHNSVRTTRIYTHVRASDLHQAINSLPSPLRLAGEVSNQPSNQNANIDQSVAH